MAGLGRVRILATQRYWGLFGNGYATFAVTPRKRCWTYSVDCGATRSGKQTHTYWCAAGVKLHACMWTGA